MSSSHSRVPYHAIVRDRLIERLELAVRALVALCTLKEAPIVLNHDNIANQIRTPLLRYAFRALVNYSTQYGRAPSPALLVSLILDEAHRETGVRPREGDVSNFVADLITPITINDAEIPAVLATIDDTMERLSTLEIAKNLLPQIERGTREDYHKIIDGLILQAIKPRGWRETSLAEAILRGIDYYSNVNPYHVWLPQLDKLLGGLTPGELVIVAGRPSVGKTAFLINWSYHWGINSIPNALVSLEMGIVELSDRFFGLQHNTSLREAVADSEEYREKLKEACIAAQNSKVVIVELFPDSLTSLHQVLTHVIRRFSVKAVFLDYIQLAAPIMAANREREVAALSQVLKGIARQYEIVVVAAAQLSRKAEDRHDKRPELADLRDSGALEQDADKVLLLYRPEFYGIDSFPDGSPTAGKIEIIVAKNRNGSTGSVVCSYKKPTAILP
ncbi:MAG: DnaB-like helicase C-terminal domain-containing protein [Nitrososphaerota archaeon]